MNDQSVRRAPRVVRAILSDTEALAFTLASEPKTGALLWALAAAKPGGRFLELGTGTGLSPAWLLAGMDAKARRDSVDDDANVLPSLIALWGRTSVSHFTCRMARNFSVACRPINTTSFTQTHGREVPLTGCATFTELVGRPAGLATRKYPQAIAVALALRHSWRREDLVKLAKRFGVKLTTKDLSDTASTDTVDAPARTAEATGASEASVH